MKFGKLNIRFHGEEGVDQSLVVHPTVPLPPPVSTRSKVGVALQITTPSTSERNNSDTEG